MSNIFILAFSGQRNDILNRKNDRKFNEIKNNNNHYRIDYYPNATTTKNINNEKNVASENAIKFINVKNFGVPLMTVTISSSSSSLKNQCYNDFDH
ncbi:hypothetical protein DERP_002853 [Dermatophagoides pteronyssinus]|uniref:Uncharacterized protein n=1 Tax=Dermatophagoides pteronyssinus TaxID=6956 RepID=A0ABQ8JWE6_DERPT|nr:hypothetical protein DERP_002853 [Dermatophagoides pteronyssinus]